MEARHIVAPAWCAAQRKYMRFSVCAGPQFEPENDASVCCLAAVASTINSTTSESVIIMQALLLKLSYDHDQFQLQTMAVSQKDVAEQDLQGIARRRVCPVL